MSAAQEPLVSTLNADQEPILSTMSADQEPILSTISADQERLASTINADQESILSTMSVKHERIPSTISADKGSHPPSFTTAQEHDSDAVQGIQSSITPVYEFNTSRFHDFTNVSTHQDSVESSLDDGRRMTVAKEPLVHAILAETTGQYEPKSEDAEGDLLSISSPEPEEQSSELSVAPSEASLTHSVQEVPESPGLRPASYSVLARDRLALALASSGSSFSQTQVEVPGSILNPGSLSNNIRGEGNGKQKKVVSPPNGKFGLGGRRRPLPKSTEELEVARLRDEMRATAALREKNQSRMLFAVASGSGAAAPVRSTKKLTVPKPFIFRSESTAPSARKALTNRQSLSGEGATAPVAQRGRSRTRSMSTSFSGPRISRSSSIGIETKDFTPLSVQTQSFFARRSESIGNARQVPARTLPQEFRLSTPRRNMEAVLTSEEKELLKIKEHSAFKARKMPRKQVYQSTGDVGVPRIHKKTSTVIKEFSFATSRRSLNAKSVRSLSSRSDDFQQFKAASIPKSVLNPTPTRKVQPKRPTVAVSPRLSKPRARPSAAPVESMPVPAFHARPAPDFSKTPKMHLHVPEPTQPDPFPLQTEERGAVKKLAFQGRIQAELKAAEEARLYKAQPIVFSSPVKFQPGQTPLTTPNPFHLQSEEHRQRMKSLFFQKVQEEMDKEEDQFSSFRASRPLHLLQEPFVPEPSNKPPAEIVAFNLPTDQRSVKRKEFNRQIEEQHREAELVRKEYMLDKEKANLENLNAQLEQVRFKAQPYKPVVPFKITKSSATLTTPMSPVFPSIARSMKKSSRAIA